MRNALVLGGVVFLAAGVSLAGGRSRGGETLRAGGGSAEAAAPQVREISPGVAQAVINGQTLTARANNMVSLEEVMNEYGSPKMYTAAILLARMLSTQGPDGSMIYANNMVMAEGLAKTSPEQQLEARKQVMPWMSQDIGGATVTVFADNMTMVGMDPRTKNSHPAVASTQNQGTMIWATNNIENP
jgi:hypothetical protein